MSKKNSNTNNTANSKTKKTGNKRPVFKVTVVPTEGRFSFESRKKITSQKVFDMCFSAASIISSIAWSDNPPEDEEMAAEFGFSLMTSMLSSFATVMDTQGDKEAIEYACRLACKNASSAKPFSISFFREQGLEHMNIMYSIFFDDESKKMDDLSLIAFTTLCLAKMAIKFIPHKASDPNEGILIAASMGVQYISNVYDAQDEFIDNICNQYESIIDGYESGDGYDDDDYDDDYDDEDITDDDMSDIDRFISNGNGLVS